MKKLTIVLTTAIFTLVIALGLIGSQSKADEVTFHNSQVEAAIRQQLEKSKGKIYKSDLKRVEVLSIS